MNKNIPYIAKSIFGILVLCTFIHCAGSKNATSDQNSQSYNDQEFDADKVNTDDHGNTPITLSDLLRRASGVQIIGSGDNIKIKVRGAQSFGSETQPLFVVDGTPMGTSYSAVNKLVNPRLVKSINVLKGSASALYGSRAANGVISIEMKKG